MIIIFAHPRSGSNSLQEILETNPKIRILREPFNTKSLRDWDPDFEPLMNVKDLETMESYLKLVSKKYNGIKTLADQLSTELNISLLINPNNSIIILSRKNLLKAAISKIIGEKTDIWSVDKNTIEDYRKYMGKFNIGYLELGDIDKKIKEFRNSMVSYKKILKENNIKFFNLYHEELFSKSVSKKDKIKKAKKIFDFLGYHDKLNVKEIKEILNPKIKNMTDKNIYLKIRNIREIENKLGNEENGFLFQKDRIINNLKNNLKGIFY